MSCSNSIAAIVAVAAALGCTSDDDDRAAAAVKEFRAAEPAIATFETAVAWHVAETAFCTSDAPAEQLETRLRAAVTAALQEAQMESALVQLHCKQSATMPGKSLQIEIGPHATTGGECTSTTVGVRRVSWCVALGDRVPLLTAASVVHFPRGRAWVVASYLRK